MIGMMCEETVRCFIGFACSVVECQHQTFSSFTLLVLCSCFSKSTVLFFFFFTQYIKHKILFKRHTSYQCILYA